MQLHLEVRDTHKTAVLSPTLNYANVIFTELPSICHRVVGCGVYTTDHQNIRKSLGGISICIRASYRLFLWDN